MAAFKTNSPIIFTLVVLLVFAFTSVVFVIYDWYVTKRQRKVHQVAATSSAIVTSLFPAQVRDKLYQNQTIGNPSSKGGGGASGYSNKLKGNTSDAAMAAGVGGDGESGSAGAGSLEKEELGDYDSPPIADLFPSATVLFMDIAG
jgi:Na+-translocating ferredoxin:NAD+ oxidoreductase RnfG subunit